MAAPCGEPLPEELFADGYEVRLVTSRAPQQPASIPRVPRATPFSRSRSQTTTARDARDIWFPLAAARGSSTRRPGTVAGATLQARNTAATDEVPRVPHALFCAGFGEEFETQVAEPHSERQLLTRVEAKLRKVKRKREKVDAFKVKKLEDQLDLPYSTMPGSTSKSFEQVPPILAPTRRTSPGCSRRYPGRSARRVPGPRAQQPLAAPDPPLPAGLPRQGAPRVQGDRFTETPPYVIKQNSEPPLWPNVAGTGVEWATCGISGRADLVSAGLGDLFAIRGGRIPARVARRRCGERPNSALLLPRILRERTHGR